MLSPQFKSKPKSFTHRVLTRTLSGLDRVHLLDMMLVSRSLLPRRSLVVFNYHRVLDGDTGFDEGVVSATAREFEEQMAMLGRMATTLSVDGLVQVLRGERELPDNAAMITFDDGYSDNSEIALPVLLRHGVRATFFVSTGFIETGHLPWWDRVSYVLKHTSKGFLRLTYPVPIDLPNQPGRERFWTRRVLLRLIKHAMGLDHQRFFAELEAAAEVEVDEAALARGLFMNWEQLTKLHQAGMDIGAHTHSHRVLQTLEAGEARRELLLPQQILRERLGVAPRAIAYPVGFPLRSGLRDLVLAAGYEVGFTFVPGMIHPGNGAIDRFNLPRLSVDRADGGAAARFKAALLMPSSLL